MLSWFLSQKKWQFVLKCWVDFCHKKVVIHCLHQIKEMHVLGFCHTKSGNLSLNGSWFLSQKVAIHVYIRVKLQRYLDFCHTKCGNFSLDGELTFVTKKLAIHCLHRSKCTYRIGIFCHKKSGNLSLDWKCCQLGVFVAGAFAMCLGLAAAGAWLGYAFSQCRVFSRAEQ